MTTPVRTIIMAALALAVATLTAAAPLTPAQTLDRRSIGELQFSPDGARLVFTVTEPPQGTTRPRHLWMLDVATGLVRQITTSAKSEWAPRWSPDGRTLAMLSDRGGPAQVYLLPMATGGEAVPLTDTKEAVREFRWSPDGRTFALLMPEPKPDALERREREKDDGRVVDKDDRRPRLWTVDVATHELRQVTRGTWDISDFEWLPDGTRLVAVANDHPESDRWIDRLYAIAMTDGTFSEVAAPRGPFGGLAVSPDGRTIAYVGSRVDGPEPHDIYLQPVGGGAAVNLTGTTLDRGVRQVHWTSGSALMAIAERGFKSAFVTVDRQAGQPAAIRGIDVNPTTFARANNGTLAFVGETVTEAPEVWLKTSAGTAKKVTALNAQWAPRPVVAPEFIKYKSFDGVEIEAALLLPRSVDRPAVDRSAPDRSAKASRDTALPLVVLVHGGPTGRWSDSFEPWGQLLVSRGYAVLYPNVRGSTGYGQRFIEMNRADWGGGDFKDVMAGVDAMIARGVADPDRLGIGGWSYGGYMAAWAVTQTTRFKAAVSGAPVIDMASEFGTEAGPAYDEWFYGLPYEKLDGFVKSSPITYVKSAKTPTLLLQGEDDVTDPIGQSQQFYRGLKRYGVESDLVLYPREGHGLREEKHLLDRLDRVIAWFDKYLKPNGTRTQ
jgi:dipeptidyl aminopeptidase/acylaminoacyl peptidase